MKKVFGLLVFLMMIMSANCVADETNVEVDTPKLKVNGNNVDLNFNITGVAPAEHDVQIYICVGCSVESFGNSSVIQKNGGIGQTTVKNLINSGWGLRQIIPIGTVLSNSGLYLLFTK